jgi:two-component system, NarL family, sensor kinase
MPESFREHQFCLFFCLIIAMLACRSEDATHDVQLYTKPPEEKLDSLTNWFATETNLNEKQYLPQFYKHFNQKTKNQQWEEAAILLYYAGQTVFVNSQSDSLIIKTHEDFIEQHQNAISDRYQSGLYLNLGILNYYDSNFEKAIAYLKKVTQIPHKDYYTLENISTAFTELSYTYTEMGKFDKALEASFKSLESSIMQKDTVGFGAGYDAIAGVYLAMKDYQNAEIYMNKAIYTLDAAKHHMGVFAVYLNKLGLYEETHSTKLGPLIDSMFVYHQQHDFKNDSYKVYAYSWKIQQLLEQKKIADAKKLLYEVKPLFEQAEEKFLFNKYLSVAAEFDKITEEKTVDSQVYKQAIPKYKEKKNLQGLLSCYDALREEAIKKNDYKTAMFYTDAYDETYDSLTDRLLIMKTKELDKRYQIKKKEQQITLQKHDITQKKTQIALLIALLIGLLLAIWAFYSWQKQKNLKQEKENSMSFTKQLLENTEDERKRIAGDLHDSVSHELLNLKTIFSQDLSVVNEKIDAIINDIRSISRNLHPVMFDKIGLVPNIEQLVERLQNQNNFFISTDINYKGTLSSADELQIYRIIQEALTNIIKYAQAYAAKITILEDKSKITIEIKDNGKGFDVKQILNSGKAFGLHNIIERSRVIGAEANIKSTVSGTVITIEIKV